MHSSSSDSGLNRTATLVTVAGLWLLAAGCTSVDSGSAAKPAQAPLGVPAPIPGELQLPKGRDVSCRIQMIDGKMVDKYGQLSRGRHRLIVALDEKAGEFSGDVDVFIPTTKRYQLKADRDGDILTISLFEEESATVVAISAASVAPMMRFQVFVHQK